MSASFKELLDRLAKIDPDSYTIEQTMRLSRISEKVFRLKMGVIAVAGDNLEEWHKLRQDLERLVEEIDR